MPFVYPVKAITLRQIFIQVPDTGDTDIILSSQLGPMEYAGILTKKTELDAAVEAHLEQNPGKDVDILCSDMRSLQDTWTTVSIDNKSFTPFQ